MYPAHVFEVHLAVNRSRLEKFDLKGDTCEKGDNRPNVLDPLLIT
jgi:hypothetical protein